MYNYARSAVHTSHYLLIMRPHSSLRVLLLADAAFAVDLTSLVNLFIGTASGANGGSGGNVFPGAAVPHAMVKVGIDVSTAPRQAGYISDNSSITGISLMHDEGTGGNTNGGYGIFPLFPLTGCSFTSCPVGLSSRQALRAAGTDAATPGYFTTTFVNNIKLEATSTRRAGLIRFTYPSNSSSNHVVVDLSNDLQRSFHGGSLSIEPTGQVRLGGTFLQSYGTDNYTVFACYDFTRPSVSNSLIEFGTYKSESSSAANNVTISPFGTSLNFPFTSNTNAIQAGALLSFNASSITARFGVSFISSEQACVNANEEIPDWNWDGVQEASRSKWADVLNRVDVDTTVEDKTVVELLYSSLYRASLVPANLTGENPYWNSPYPFYDALFCSWDTFRTVHPLLSITSPFEWSEIVNAYVDGWRNTGYIPECRANTKAGYVQGGSDGMPILGDFAVKYGSHASELGVPTDDLYQALVDTAENTPPDWYRVGRQNTAWKTFGYIPTDWTDPSGSTGLPTREASRAYEYALGDFAVRQAGIALGKPSADVTKYANRSMNFVNMWDPNVTSDGFTGFAQRRYANGTFAFSPPNACSPVDPTPHSCARGTDNNVGFYESSSWEMSFFAPHSMSTLISFMGGDGTFVSRIDHYFSNGYFQAGNEPSFQIPWLYHYANRPDLSAQRVRNIVYKNFNTGIGGIPGNDDSGAMAALLTFHLLGLYPVPSSTQLLIGSPFVSSYTIHNALFDTSTTVTTRNFDSSTLVQIPPAGSRLYVQSVTVNGEVRGSICWIDWKDLVGGGEIVIEVGSDPAVAKGCGEGEGARPDSLESGGFSAASASV
ncbi:glycosyl hydrolase family 92-domain-containing protein [Cyathus striatus]|nr:glycosyl hydrolase family 92-domain-containing protein [Cyathus striatus]